jgi:Tfp pilus assembly PilM family ATPase
LCGIVAQAEGASVQINRGFTHAWPDDFDPLQSPGQAAMQLRNRLANLTSSPPKVIVSLSREDVILRHLDVPDVADEELPNLVRYQAAARSTTPLDQLLLDFLPLPKQPGHEGRPVLAITAPKPFITGIQTVLRDAGLEPAEITFNSIGLGEFTAHVDRQRSDRVRQPALAVHKDGHRIELVILSENRLVYAHAARLSDEDASASVTGLLAEVSRTIVAAQRLHPQLKIHHAYVSGSGDEIVGLASSLSERLAAPAEFVEPKLLSAVKISHRVSTEEVAPTPVLIGLALAEASRLTPTCDFLHPRQPPPKVNLRKLQLAVGAAAALLISVFVFGGTEWARASLQRQIQALDIEEKDLQFKITPGMADLNAAKLIDQWQAGNLQQIEQLAALEDLMEGTDRMYLSQYAFTVGGNDAIGGVQAYGNAKSRDDITQFQQRLVDTKSFRIQARQLAQLSNDDEYPNRFEIHADLLPKPKTVPVPAAQPSTAKP